MGLISVEQFLEHPERLLSDAEDGEIDVVTRDGEPVFLALPIGTNVDGRGFRMELAVSLFDSEQVSIGVASRIAGLSVSQMIDELGRRHISVVRYSADELTEEVRYLAGLAARR